MIQLPRARRARPTLLAAALVCLLALGGCSYVKGALTGATPEPQTLDLSNTNLTDVSGLLDKTNLVSLDLRGNPISAADYETLRAALPNCEILWSVPVGDERVDSDAQALTLAELPEDAIPLLSHFPDLKTVTISVSDESNYAALMELAARYPNVAFSWNVPCKGETFPNTATALDLSGKTLAADELAAMLAGLPNLAKLTLDAASPLTAAEQIALATAYPNVTFLWDVHLLDDLTVRSDVTELDLRGCAVPDAAAFSDKLVLLKNLARLDMCNCGPTDDEMAAMRARYPKIKFIWMTRVSKWIVRTDIPGFSTGNKRKFPNGMGEFVGTNTSFRDIHAADFENLKYCTDLVALDVGHCAHIGNIDFIAELPKLKYLIVSLCDITDVSPIADQTDLEFLEIKYNYLTDISCLSKLTKLRYLNCSNNLISDFSVVYSMPKLERLWISCNNFAEQDVAVLQANMPNTVIKASLTNPEYAESLWRKDNEGYLAMQKLFGMRAQNQGTPEK